MNVLYTPRKESLSMPEGCSYLEIWDGLPDLDFQQCTDGNGRPTLRYEQDGNYVWVNHNTVEALESDSPGLLIAHCRKIGRKLQVISVEPAKDMPNLGVTLDEIVLRASDLNIKWIKEAFQKAFN